LARTHSFTSRALSASDSRLPQGLLKLGTSTHALAPSATIRSNSPRSRPRSGVLGTSTGTRPMNWIFSMMPK
jgi:hypothetical protein